MTLTRPTDRFAQAWARWDSGWRIDIITRRYRVGGPTETVQSNHQFWALYPFLVKAVLILDPPATLVSGSLLSYTRHAAFCQRYPVL